ncbi:MAG: tryptophan synthase subunit alpha, partial [Burkholderiales bacterium]
RDPETARRIAGVADAVVIGSRLVQEIENAPADEMLQRVTTFMRSIREAMDAVPAGAPAA